MSDYKELKEMLDFALPFAMVLDDKLQDGFQWSDLLALVPVMPSLPAAIAGFNNIDDELASLDDEGRKELIDHVAAKFDIQDDKAEALVEQGLRAGFELTKLITMVRE